MKNPLFLFYLLLGAISMQAQHAHTHSRVIKFPNTAEYKSVSCDFHIHTVFSDGSVWPDIRVHEALRDSVDAISLTEHIEYQPHKDDIPHPDFNRSFEIATKIALPFKKLLVVRGAEITRDMPPGHNNAIFIKDANKLKIQDSVEVFREVVRQGGFTFWNHPNWVAQREDGIARLDEMHRFLIKEKLLHGIEVVNDLTYSDEALQIALDNDLTIMGTSDVHGLVDWQYGIEEGGHRPVTIALASEKTEEGIKEALFAGRTIAYFKDMLIGKEENVVPLVEASLQITKAEYQPKANIVKIDIKNLTGVAFILANMSNYTFHAHSDIVTLAPHEITTIEIKTINRVSQLELPFQVMNAVIAPKKHPLLTFKVMTK